MSLAFFFLPAFQKYLDYGPTMLKNLVTFYEFCQTYPKCLRCKVGWTSLVNNIGEIRDYFNMFSDEEAFWLPGPVNTEPRDAHVSTITTTMDKTAITGQVPNGGVGQ